jgi:hypothetical protein
LTVLLLLGCASHHLPPGIGALRVETALMSEDPNIELYIPTVSAPSPVPGMRVEIPLVDDPRERIARAVDPDPVEQALGEGIAAALTPPLGLTSDPTAPVLSVDVNSWGVRQAESGYVNRGPSTFWFTMRARIYDTKDRAIFSIGHTCQYQAPAAVTEMPRDAVMFRFVAAAEACGRELIQVIRDSAEPPPA